MVKFYKTVNGTVTEIENAENGCWISVIAPTEEEIRYIIEAYGLDAGFVRSSLDEEESSRIEAEEDQTLIIVDYAVTETDTQNAILYSTLPMGIILTQTNVVTISSRENIVLSEMSGGVVKNLQTHLKTRFLLMILLRIAAKYLQYLKQIDKITSFLEKHIHKSMKNKELIQLLDLEKSLVYFSTSLKANEITLEKILRGRVIKLYEDDQDLLEDVLIEIKQSIEMADIYSNILSRMVDAFGSVTSNNLNNVMNRLTIITILMTIPTIISGFYGMNVDDLPIPHVWFPTVLSIVATAITGFILWEREK
ncbi:MAG: magnesium transporter CorA family protein [Oscillospiraceae bacterium]|nr:magnesium transporter CorA family protein [Oscillospiraceae bacterium]